MNPYLPRATYSDRCKAQIIIQDLRDQYPCYKVAEMLGIQRAYVCFIEYKTERLGYQDKAYYAPSWAIKQVLEWDKNNADNGK